MAEALLLGWKFACMSSNHCPLLISCSHLCHPYYSVLPLLTILPCHQVYSPILSLSTHTVRQPATSTLYLSGIRSMYLLLNRCPLLISLSHLCHSCYSLLPPSFLPSSPRIGLPFHHLHPWITCISTLLTRETSVCLLL